MVEDKSANNAKKFVPVPASLIRVGTRLEAKDPVGDQWFPVKITEVAAGGEKILVHYVQWNSRHDEWIPVDSTRLRVPLRTSGRHESGSNSPGVSGSNSLSGLESCDKTANMMAQALSQAKDFKSGEKVMAVWKLNRKFPAKVLSLEPDGTFLVEFYDGVQHCVKPNNIRRMRKDEEEQHSNLLSSNGLHRTGGEKSEENSDGEEMSPVPENGSTSGRRERKKKFDLKSVLNLRPSGPSKGKSTPKSKGPTPKTTPKTTPGSAKAGNKKDVKQPEETPKKTSSKALEVKPTTENGSTKKSATKKKKEEKLEAKAAPVKPVKEKPKPSSIMKEIDELPTPNKSSLQPVTGKRERKRKKFWDDEHEDLSALPPSKISRKKDAKRENKTKSKNSVSLVTKQQEEETIKEKPDLPEAASPKVIKEKSIETPPPRPPPPAAATTTAPIKEPKETNGKLLRYRMFDMSLDPQLIAAEMIEGVNIPGRGVSIPVDSSKLPIGWEKRVIQRGIGVTKGKWDVFIVEEDGRKAFRSKTELQKHIDEKKLPYTSDAFDFSLDDKLKKLRQIWKQYIVKPRQSPGERLTPQVPAKKGRKKDPEKLSNDRLLATKINDVTVPAKKTLKAEGELKLGVASETGQGLRCSIPNCGKLFRRDKLLRQHVKHYHPKVFDQWLKSRKYSNTSEMSDEEDAFLPEPPPRSSEKALKKRKISKPDHSVSFSESKGADHKRIRTVSSSSNVPDISINDDIENMGIDPPALFCRTPQSGRDRKDSVLSVGSSSNVFFGTTSDQEEVENQTVAAKGFSTPPTFRLSKRRQAQLRRKRAMSSLTTSNLKNRQFMDDIERLQQQPMVTINSLDEGSIAAALRLQNEEALSPAGASASHSSYPPSEMDTSVTSEHLTTEEVVNCACKRTEEDGLMIQCDICLCWQHGSCLGIEEEDQVQEYYVCETCRHPRLGRTDAQLSVDQDWLNKGALPGVDGILSAPDFNQKPNESVFRKLSDLMADLSNLNKVLHSLRVKLNVASQNSSKVFMWSSVWDAPEPTIADLKAEELRELCYSKEKEEPPPPPSTSTSCDFGGQLNSNESMSNGESNQLKPSTDKNANSFSTLEGSIENGKTSNGSTNSETPVANGDKLSEVNSLLRHESTKVGESLEPDEPVKEFDEVSMKVNGCSSPSSPPKEEDQANGSGQPSSQEVVPDIEVDPSMIPSLSEVQRLLPDLMNSLQQEESNQNHQEVAPPPVTAPTVIMEPKRIDKDECRMNLLHHIDAVQTEFENRLNEIEKTLDQLEAAPTSDNTEMAVRIKSVLALLLQDVESSKNLVFSQ